MHSITDGYSLQPDYDSMPNINENELEIKTD